MFVHVVELLRRRDIDTAKCNPSHKQSFKIRNLAFDE
jgi:hypothetical protein